jgi:hypothetical protein
MIFQCHYTECLSFKLDVERRSTGEGRLPKRLVTGGRTHAHLCDSTVNILNKVLLKISYLLNWSSNSAPIL